MSDPINFDIDALVARYELHPERKDVFVEAEGDRGLIRTFLEKHGHSNVSVFSIAVVNVPADLVLRESLPHPSCRSDVIALAMELARKGVPPSKAACIADADLERVLPKNRACALLLLTDYTSLELYAFVVEIVHDVLLLVSPRTAQNGANLLKELTGPLEFLFVARATNVDLQLGLSWIESIERFFSLKDGRIDFAEAEFTRRYVRIRLPGEKVSQFEARLGELRSLSCSDIRFRIRGHDFIRVLGWYLRRVEKCRHLNDDAVRQMLYLRLRPEDLAEQPMFASLLARFAACGAASG